MRSVKLRGSGVTGNASALISSTLPSFSTESVEKMIERCREEKFYGRIEIVFKNGKAVHVVRSESFKIDEVDNAIR